MKIIPVEKQKFNKSDLDFLLILEENELFEEVVKGIRKKVGLPDVGFRTEYIEGKVKVLNFHSDTNEIIDKASTQLNEPVKDLISAFSLPSSWWNTLFSIIILNVATPPMRDIEWYKPVEIKYISGLSTITAQLKGNFEHTSQLEPHIEISIREGLSFAELIDELNKQKAILEKYLGYLDSTPNTSHLKDIELKKEINNLDVRDLLQVSQSTATDYLTELSKSGRLKSEKKARATVYRS